MSGGRVDVIVIGAGFNGLVAGAWLARRKRRVLVLDQQPVPGGAAVTTEFAPGFRAPTLSHALGPVAPDVLRALRLDRSGLEVFEPDPALTTLGRDGSTVVFHPDPILTAASIHRISPGDAGRWPEFIRTTGRMAALGAWISRRPPPPLDATTTRERWRLLRLGREVRRLGGRDLARLARWIPMAVADLAGEWFDDDLVRAAIAAHAIFGNPVGPWSAGTGGMLLQRLAADPLPVGSGVTVRGGPGALSDAVARIAREAGAAIRTSACVAAVNVHQGGTAGVTLDTGEHLEARAVVAAVDPRRLFLSLLDARDLPASFVERIRRYRARGVTAKINLALAAEPALPALAGDPAPLRGRLLVAPGLDYLERAFDATKYGRVSEEPWLDVSMPTVTDPSFAPSGSHVLSIVVHCAPRHLREGRWPEKAGELYASVLRVLEPHCPGLASLVVGREIITPEDLEARWGLSGGHLFHGEPALDQSWLARPVLGWSAYRTPIAGLFLGGAGAHPGGGLTGLPGLLSARAADRHLRA